MQVDDLDIIEFTPTFWASAPLPLVLRNDALDPGFNCDFSSMRDDGTEYMRGDRRYYRPYGWKRHALRVQGKYEDDTWLGAGMYIMLHVAVIIIIISDYAFTNHCL